MNKKDQRADIEGLRGLAVLAVVFFHSGLKIASGGYIGVDVFFVISGYLISKSIICSFGSPKGSLLQFYERRFRRIIPAAVAVIFMVGALGLTCLFPEELSDLVLSIRSALLLKSNLFAAYSTDYFGIATEFKPLIHFWSLSIELQFYLFFPVLLYLSLYVKQLKLFSQLILITIISLLIFNSIRIIHDPVQGYFSSLMRSWELLMGAWLCISHLDEKLPSKKVAEYFPVLGLVLIFISLGVMNQKSHFPGVLALFPCIGSALILLSGGSHHPVLSNRFIRALGLISYSLYLVHQPLFAYYRIVHARSLTELESIVLIGLAILCSIILWLLIERPAQSSKIESKGLVYASFFPTVFLIFAVVHLAQTQSLPQFKLQSKVAQVLNFRYDNNPRLDECRTDKGVINPVKACHYGDKSLPTVALWGDSHVDQIVGPLAKAFKKYEYSIQEFSIAGCPPIPHTEPSGIKRNCAKNVEAIVHYLIQQKDIVHVFLHAYWIGYLDEGLIQTDDSSLSIKDSLTGMVKTLTEAGKIVHLIYPVPKMKVDPPLYLARLKLIHPGRTLPLIHISNKDYVTQAKVSIQILDKLSEALQLNSIRIAKALYDAKSSSYYANNQEQVYYRDDNHLSVTGGKRVAAFIAKKAFQFRSSSIN